MNRLKRAKRLSFETDEKVILLEKQSDLPENGPLTPKQEEDEAGKNWLPLIIPVAIISAFAELGYAVVNNSAFPVYMKKGLGVSATMMTWVMVPFFISEVLFKAPFGVIADRYGRKALMVIGPALTIFTPIATILIPYVRHSNNYFYLSCFAFFRLLDGAGAAALWPAMFAYVGDVVHKDKRSAAMSFLNVTYIVGLALGFLAGGWANDTFGPILAGEPRGYHVAALGRRMITTLRHAHHSYGVVGPVNPSLLEPAHYYPSFGLASILFAAAVIVAILAIKEKVRSAEPKGTEVSPEEEKMNLGAIADAVKTAPGMMALTFICFVGIGCIALLVKVFALDELNITEKAFGNLILLPAVVVGALAIPFGYLSDFWGKVRSVRLGFICCTVGMWSIIAMYGSSGVNETSIVIAGSLLGLGFVLAFPAWMALLTTLSAQNKRGTLIGAISTAQGIGVLTGALIGSRLYDYYSPDRHISHISPFFASAVFLTISTILSFILIKNTEPKKLESELK
jgi:MFS family permease